MTRSTLFLLALGCSDGEGGGGDGQAAEVDRSCDPIVPEHCGMPFPSTFFMEEDPSTETGWRVALGPTTLPADVDGRQPDPWIWNEYDGFSSLTMLVALLPGATLEGTVPFTDIGAYADEAAKTVVVDVETGERHPHWVELDQRSDEPDRTALVIRPARPFEHGHRYVVGIRGLVDAQDRPLAPSDAFAALVAGEETGDPRVDDRQDLYDEVIFPALEAQGWSRDEVLLAWDFVVGSIDGSVGRALAARDDLLSRIGEDGPDYRIDEVVEPEDGAWGRIVFGTMTVPMYTEQDEPPTLLTRGDDGMPYANGTREASFVVAIPRVLLEDPHPAPTVQYGHGFFGDIEEVWAEWADWNQDLAAANGWILYGSNWTGMSEEDVGEVALLVATDMGMFPALPERTVQGFLEALALERLLHGALQEDPALQRADPETGEPVDLVDESRRWFYGVSQGGILGAGYLALSPDIDRAVFGVTGIPYTLLTSRSSHFDEFFVLFDTMYDDPADILFWQAAMQTPWDIGEGAGYATRLTDDPLPGSSAKRVLVQNAIGDAQVSTLGGHVLARAVGARLVGEPAREVWGLETVDSPWAGSALVEWDYGVEEPTDASSPDPDTDTHGGPRREETGQEQIAIFFETGEVVHTCDGPCDPD